MKDRYDTLAALYRSFYGLELSLLEDGHILVRTLKDRSGSQARGWLLWLVENREHAIARLKKEGWQ